jgi:fibronectin type 3 domain-containing protein
MSSGPDTPTGLAALSQDEMIDLSWNPVANATEYIVYRSHDDGGNSIFDASYSTVEAGIYLFLSDFSANIVYGFSVTSIVDGVESSPSELVYSQIYRRGPSNLMVTGGVNRMDISWMSIPGATSYIIYQTNLPHPTTVIDASYSVVETSIALLDLSNSRSYSFTVSAIIDGFESLRSNSMAANVYAPPPTGLAAVGTGSAIDLSWNPVAGTTTYYLFRYLGGVQQAMYNTGTNTHYTVTTGITVGVEYSFRVMADGGPDMYTAESDPIFASTSTGQTPALEPAPTGLGVAGQVAMLDLSWNPVTGATEYIVYRSHGEGPGDGILDASYSTVDPNFYFYLMDFSANSVQGFAVSAIINGVETARSERVFGQIYRGAPSNLMVEGGVNRMDISWNPISDAISYIVYQTNLPHPTTVIDASYSVVGTKLTLLDLSNSRSYSFTVSAIVPEGETVRSNPMSANVYAPPPTGLAAVGTGTAIDLSWNPVAGTTTYYLFRYLGGVQQAMYNTGTNTHYTVTTGITAGVEYSFRVMANGGPDMYTAQSDPVFASTTTGLPVLAQPAQPTVTGTSPGTVDLSWSDVSGATSYIVYYKTAAAAQYDLSAAAAGTTATLTSLVNGTTYMFAIAAIGPGGQSSLSTSATATPRAAAPTGLQVIGGINRIDASWSAVSNATAYTVYRINAMQEGMAIDASYVIVGTTIALLDVSNSRTYGIAVSATVAGAETAMTEPVYINVYAPPPANFHVASGAAAIDISWSAVAGATTYTVRRSLAAAPTTTLYMYNTANTSLQVTDVSANIAYSFEVSATGPDIYTARTTPATGIAYSIPAKPTISDVSGIYGVAIVSWTAVADVTSYVIFYRPSTASQDLSLSVPAVAAAGQQEVATIQGIPKDVPYTFSVAGVNGPLQGTRADQIQATGIAPAPANIQAAALPGTVTFTWSAINPATSYVVRRYTDTSGLVLAATYNTGSTATTYTVTDAPHRVPSYYTITAIANAAESYESAPALAATPFPQSFVSSYDITTRGTAIYTSGYAQGDISFATAAGTIVVQADGPYISAASLATGQHLWARAYTTAANVLIASPTQLIGIDTSAALVTGYDISGGAPLWTRAAPMPTELFYDYAGHIHVVGRFTGTYTPGGTASPITTATNDAYLLTLDTSGTPIAATNLTASLHNGGATLQIYPTCVTIDDAHNTYVGGTYTGVGTDLSASELYNASFVVSVTEAGEKRWVRSVDADFLDNLYDIEYRDGRIYICGSYHHRSRYLAFDEVIALPAAPDSAGEGYVAALDVSGTYLWAQKIGCDISSSDTTRDQSVIRGITIDPSGTIYFAGEFSDNPVKLDVSGAPVQIPFTNTDRQGFFGSARMVTVPPSAPLPPVDLSAVSLSPNAITVSWSPAATGGPARSFRVLYKPYYESIYSSVVNTYDLSYTFTGLSSLFVYSFVVEAVGPGGISQASTEVIGNALADIPAAPTGLTASPANMAADLSWNPVNDASTYTVFVRQQGASIWDISYSMIYDARFTVLGLSNTTSYEFAVSAQNSAGSGPLSSSVLLQPAYTVPATPSNPYVVATNEALTLFWTADTNADTFTVYYKDISAQSYDSSSVTVPQFTAIVPNGIEYSFYVVAEGLGGTSAASEVVAGTAQVPVPVAPQVGAASGYLSALLSITDVSYATTYNIYQAVVPAVGQGSPVYVPASPATVQSPLPAGGFVTISDLSNNISYYLKVTATGVSGTSPDSAILTVTPFTPTPAQPFIVGTAKESETSVSVTWTTVTYATEYRIYYRLVGAGSWGAPVVVAGQEAATGLVTGLTTSQTYEFAVAGFGDGGEGDKSVPAQRTVTAYPAPPSGLAGTAIGTSIDISWNPVAGATSYTFYRRNAGVDTWNEVVLGADTTSKQSPASYGATYEFSVSVVTADGPSTLATPVSIGTPFPLPAAPVPAAAAADGRIDVSWSSVLYAYEYLVRATPTGVGPGYTAGTPDISAAITDVSAILVAANGVEYAVTVASIGTSGSSASAAAGTVLPLPPLCAAPANMAADASNSFVSISWAQVSRADTYTVLWGEVAGQYDASLSLAAIPAPLIPDPTDPSANPVPGPLPPMAVDISGLANDTTYYFTVAGANYAGEGSRATEAAATPRIIPAAPEGLRAAGGDTTVDLSWSPVALATKYNIYMTTDGYPYELMGDVVEPRVLMNSLTIGVLYKFRISAVNVEMEGPPSAEATAIPVVAGQAAVPVVEPPTETTVALLNVLSSQGAVNEADQALFEEFLGGVLDTGSSSIVVDADSNRTIGVFSVADIVARKELTPDAPVLVDSRATVYDVLPPEGTAAVIVNMLPVGTSTINLGSVTNDVIFDVQRYNALKQLLASVNFDPTTYTSIVFERDTSDVNVYRVISDTTVLMLALSPLDVDGKIGQLDCSGQYLGKFGDKYRFSYFGPFSYTLITGISPTAPVACFVSGTRVVCPGGSLRRVDDLQAGDLVLCDDGRAVPVKTVYATRLAAVDEARAPVVIPRGFCGLERELVISDCHAVRCRGASGGWLIPRVAERKAGRRLFERRGVGEAVTYYHVEMPEYLRDNLVLEGGIVAESFGQPWGRTQTQEVLRGLWRMNGRGLLDRMPAAGRAQTKPLARIAKK